jgi:hypothetical protein
MNIDLLDRPCRILVRRRETVCALMPDPVDALILDLLEWIGLKARPYQEVIEAWRTSCPQLPVWEEANARGFVEHHHSPGSDAMVSVCVSGTKHLAERRREDATPVRTTHD